MSVVNDVAQKALEIFEQKPMNASFISALDAAEEKGLDRIAAQTFLIGLLAIRIWHQASHELLKYYQQSAEIRRLKDGMVTTSFHGVAEKRDELNRFSRDHYEVLLTLGYMAQCGATTVSKKYIYPLAPAIAHVFSIERDDEHQNDEAFRMYQNLSKRVNDLKRNCDDPSVIFEDGKQMFQTINATLYRLS